MESKNEKTKPIKAIEKTTILYWFVNTMQKIVLNKTSTKIRNFIKVFCFFIKRAYHKVL